MTNPNFPSDNLPAHQGHNQGVNPAAPEFSTLDAAGAATFLEMMQARFSNMDNIMTAGREQSRDAMEGAALGVDMVTEALTADPDAYAVIGRHHGPLSMMANAAGNTHTLQTGHSLREAHFLSSDYTDLDGGMKVLAAIKAKMLDQRWDGTSTAGRKVDTTAAHGRKTTAIAAVQALKEIADARGHALVAVETVEKINAFMRKSAPRH